MNLVIAGLPDLVCKCINDSGSTCLLALWDNIVLCDGCWLSFVLHTLIFFQGQHALVYDINTARETWEWVDIKEVCLGIAFFFAKLFLCILCEILFVCGTVVFRFHGVSYGICQMLGNFRKCMRVNEIQFIL